MKIFLLPRFIKWDSVQESLIGKSKEGKTVIIPKEQMAIYRPNDLKRILEEGTYCIPIKEDGNEVIASRKECIEADYREMTLGAKYEFTIKGIAPWGLFVKREKDELICLIHSREISRAKMDKLTYFFKPGDKIIGKVIKKENGRICVSHKRCFLTLLDFLYKFNGDDLVEVMLTKKINKHAYFCEYTPGIPGIIRAEKEIVKKWQPGKVVYGKIISVIPQKGLSIDYIDE